RRAARHAGHQPSRRIPLVDLRRGARRGRGRARAALRRRRGPTPLLGRRVAAGRRRRVRQHHAARQLQRRVEPENVLAPILPVVDTVPIVEGFGVEGSGVDVADVENGEAPVSWAYRPWLDGLRAIAVYLVVLFHVGNGKFTGGYVGVDVFFVLSGYLVTQLLLRDLTADGGIRFGRFYARRIRR